MTAARLDELQRLIALDDWLAYGSLGEESAGATPSSRGAEKVPWAMFPRASRVRVEGNDAVDSEVSCPGLLVCERHADCQLDPLSPTMNTM